MPDTRKVDEHEEDGVLVFIPGASNTRIDSIKKNIQWLQKQDVPMECSIFKYQPEPLLISEEELKPCKVIDHKGYWMDHFRAVQLNETKMQYVLHMIDSVEVQNVDLRRMRNAMIDNNLVHAAVGLYGKSYYPQMKPHLGFGRLISFAELHFDLFKRDNFACLQDATSESNHHTPSHFGRGVDYSLPILCPGRIGIIDAFKVYKFAGGSYSSSGARVDKKKWMSSHHLSESGKKQKSESLEALKGEVMPTDAQCDYTTNCHLKIHQ